MNKYTKIISTAAFTTTVLNSLSLFASSNTKIVEYEDSSRTQRISLKKPQETFFGFTMRSKFEENSIKHTKKRKKKQNLQYKSHKKYIFHKQFK